MQFSQIAAVLAFTAGAMAGPAFNAELYKRTCWELTGSALKDCQTACTDVCDVVSVGLAKAACDKACTASNLKERDEALATVDSAATASNTTQTASTFVAPNEDISIGRGACVAACEVTCNSTVLALVQTKCLSKCKALCPST